MTKTEWSKRPRGNMSRALRDRRRPSGYDWDQIRGWCIAYLRLFLEYADTPDSDASYEQYRRGVKELPIEWRRAKASDEDAFAVIDIITSWVTEAVATREALPGDFRDAVEAAKEWKKVLEEDSPADVTAAKVQRAQPGLDGQ